MKRIILAACAVLAVAALTAVPATAGKGGQMSTLVANPSSLVVGESVTFSGSGYRAETQYFIYVINAAGDRVHNAGAYTDAAGNLAEAPSYVMAEVGEYTAEAWELNRGLRLAKHASASTTFTVTP